MPHRITTVPTVCRTFLLLSVCASLGAVHRTPNFVVRAHEAEIARHVAEAAEHHRRALAIEWTGRELPNWETPCAIVVRPAATGASGVTTYEVAGDRISGWTMQLNGSLERVVESILPHEVAHTVLASYFCRPLPRWADEGAAMLAETEAERRRLRLHLRELTQRRRGMPLRVLLMTQTYPRTTPELLSFYSTGYSLTAFLVATGVKTRFLEFLSQSHEGDWDRAVMSAYGDESVEDLELRWRAWIAEGSPLPDGSPLIAAEPQNRAKPPITVVSRQSR